MKNLSIIYSSDVRDIIGHDPVGPEQVGKHNSVTAGRTGIRIFGPAIVGALMQLAAVVIVTLVFYRLARDRYFPLGWPLSVCEEKTLCHLAALPVRLSYLLTAGAVALTNNRFVVQTLVWARERTRLARAEASGFSSQAAAVQLSIVAIACVVEELSAPMEAAVTLGRSIGGLWLGALLWPAILSIAVAAIGSWIHALYLSVHHN